MVRVLIDVDGQPRQMSLDSSSGHDRLEQDAIHGVRKARFRPYTANGVPQPLWVLVPIVVAGPVGKAFIMTGLGQVVALPAVMGYNGLTRGNRVPTAKLDAFSPSSC